MKISKVAARAAGSLRWVARIWGLLTCLAVTLVAIRPGDQAPAGRVPLIEWILLSLYAVSALGLLMAWKWELIGGWLAILCMAAEIIGFRLVKGMWYPDLFGFVVPILFFALPGMLFLASSALSARDRPTARV